MIEMLGNNDEITRTMLNAFGEVMYLANQACRTHRVTRVENERIWKEPDGEKHVVFQSFELTPRAAV